MQEPVSGNTQLAKARLLIVGASVRAAAWSARRAGYEVVAADLFADCDLSSQCEVHHIPAHRYPGDIPAIAAQSRADAWMFTGCIENHPEVVDRIDETIPPWGNAASVLRKVRDPLQLQDIFRRSAIPYPETLAPGRHFSASGDWLHKPYRSGNGAGIRLIASQRRLSPIDADPCYAQKFVEGESHAAVYVGTDRGATLIGVTRLWTDRDMAASGMDGDADSFRYAGSTGPLDQPASMRAQWQRIGSLLVEEFGLRGLFGVDAVLSRCGADASSEVWPVEVNPRYTASIEVLERTLGCHSIWLHAAAFDGTAATSKQVPMAESTKSPRYCGKRVLYARRDLVIDAALLEKVTRYQQATLAYPCLADVPRHGTTVREGQPMVTLLAAGRDAGDVEDQLGFTAPSRLVQMLTD